MQVFRVIALVANLVSVARAFKYAVVLDCGSRGTRLHVFRRSVDGSIEDILPQPLKIVPGLSTFADHPHGVVEYLLPLLKFAGSVVPAEAHSHDPDSAARGLGGDASAFTEVFLMGTGGMRQLTQAQEDAVLDAAVNGLNDRRSAGPHDSGHGQPFLLKRHQAVTLSGAAEAFYAALSVNYLTGTIDADLLRTGVSSPSDSPAGLNGVARRLTGALDLGGASTQIVFPINLRHNSSSSSSFSTSGSSSSSSSDGSSLGLSGRVGDFVSTDHFWAASYQTFGSEMIRERLFRHLANHHLPLNVPQQQQQQQQQRRRLAGLSDLDENNGIRNATSAFSDNSAPGPEAAPSSVLEVPNPCDLVDHTEEWVGRWGGGTSKRASRHHGQPFKFIGTGDAHGCSHVLRRVLWGNSGPGNGHNGDYGDYGSGLRAEDLWESGPLAMLGGAFESFGNGISSSSGGSGSSNGRRHCVQGVPCPIEEVTMPRVPKGTELVGMSSLFRTADALRLLAPGGLPHFPRPSLAELQKAAANFCALHWTPHRWSDDTHAHSNSKEELPRVCLHAVYVFTLLRDAYGLDLASRDLTFAHTLGGSELSWVLGAAVSQFASFRRTEAARATATADAQHLQQGSHLRPAAGSGAAAKAAALAATHRSDLERFAFQRPPEGAPPELASTLEDSIHAGGSSSSSSGGSRSSSSGASSNWGMNLNNGGNSGSRSVFGRALAVFTNSAYSQVLFMGLVCIILAFCARRRYCAARRPRPSSPYVAPAYSQSSTSMSGMCARGIATSAGAVATVCTCCCCSSRRRPLNAPGSLSRAGSWSLGMPPKRSRSGDESEMLHAL